MGVLGGVAVVASGLELLGVFVARFGLQTSSLVLGNGSDLFTLFKILLRLVDGIVV